MLALPLSEIRVPNDGFARTFTHGAGVICPGAIVMTYSRPSGVNPPSPLRKIRSRSGSSIAAGDSGATAARGWQRRDRGRGSTDPFELLCQRPIAIADDDAGDRLQQDAVLIVDLVGRAHEDAAGLVDPVGVAACSDQLRDLFVQGGTGGRRGPR